MQKQEEEGEGKDSEPIRVVASPEEVQKHWNEFAKVYSTKVEPVTS